MTPSWTRWPPNCCETCTGWERSQENEHIGTCNGSALYTGTVTDSRFRCPSFTRRADVKDKKRGDI